MRMRVRCETCSEILGVVDEDVGEGVVFIERGGGDVCGI